MRRHLGTVKRRIVGGADADDRGRWPNSGAMACLAGKMEDVMRNVNLIGAACLVGLCTMPAAAQQSDRYTLEKTESGYIRMDRRSGEMSICEERSGQLVCKLAADERLARDDEIERLQTELDALEKRVAALEGTARTALGADLPDEQTFDRALGLMERFFRRFMGIVKDLERDFRDPEPDTATPQRT